MDLTSFDMITWLFLGAGVIAGGVLMWLLLRRRDAGPQLAQLRQELQSEIERRSTAEAKLPRIEELDNLLKQRDRAIAIFQDERKEQGERIAQLEEALANEQKNATEKLAMLDDAQKKLKDAFDSLASKALNTNNEQFLRLAQQSFNTVQESAKGELDTRKLAIEGLVRPLGEALKNVDQKIVELENARVGAYATLTEQIKSLGVTQEKLQSETGNLVRALRAPHVRGRWGEEQLRKLLEMAGMTEHCDFVQQESIETENGRLRPDVKVFLPNRRMIIVDSKVPLQAYLDAVECADDEKRVAMLRDHVRQLRTHLSQLSSKAYWSQFDNTPDFVVMFLHLESAFSAALTQDPALIEDAVKQGVIIATPTTLLALLKAVAFGWRHEQIAQNAREISTYGKELHERIGKFLEHYARVGGGLDSAVKAFNAATGSLESRVLVSARKFKELGATAENELPSIRQIEVTPRAVRIEGVTPIPELPVTSAPADNGTP